MGTDLGNMVGKSGDKVDVMEIQNCGESPFSSIFSLPMQTISQTGAFVNIMSTKKLQTGDAVNSETLKAMTKGS